MTPVIELGGVDVDVTRLDRLRATGSLPLSRSSAAGSGSLDHGVTSLASRRELCSFLPRVARVAALVTYCVAVCFDSLCELGFFSGCECCCFSLAGWNYWAD